MFDDDNDSHVHRLILTKLYQTGNTSELVKQLNVINTTCCHGSVTFATLNRKTMWIWICIAGPEPIRGNLSYEDVNLIIIIMIIIIIIIRTMFIATARVKSGHLNECGPVPGGHQLVG